LQRLDAFIGEAHAKALRARGQPWVGAARRIDGVVGFEPARRPTPSPPLRLRPRQLSVTEIETLVRSPYDIYARHVLRLVPLQPLGEAPGARERGTLIHDVFARFIKENCDFEAADALARLQRFAEEAFAALDTIPEQRAIWLRRFDRAAEQFLAFERARSPEIAERHAEIEGLWTWPGGFRLKGRADRVDLRHDGRFEIIDYKTGSVPTPGAMQQFLAPQLPLEAAMVGADAFPDLKARTAEALTYIKIGLGPEAFNLHPYKSPPGMSLAGAIDAVSQSTQGHVDILLLRDDRPLLPRVLPDEKRRFAGPYDHLMRLGEWLRTDLEDEP
jgi:ATP-dependent helicase/nuclease subunit B